MVVVVLLLLLLTLTLLLTPRLGPLARLRSLCTLPHLASCWLHELQRVGLLVVHTHGVAAQ